MMAQSITFDQGLFYIFVRTILTVLVLMFVYIDSSCLAV